MRKAKKVISLLNGLPIKSIKNLIRQVNYLITIKHFQEILKSTFTLIDFLFTASEFSGKGRLYPAMPLSFSPTCAKYPKFRHAFFRARVFRTSPFIAISLLRPFRSGSGICISRVNGGFFFLCFLNPYCPSHVFLRNIPEPAPCRDSDMIFLHCRKYTCRSGEREDKKRSYLDGCAILDSCFSVAPTES